MSDAFSKGAKWSAEQCGRASTFIIALLIILVWAVSGPFFNYSDTWQLIINTGTTIITFLMVFLIQNTQNRDTAAIQLKLDELIRANNDARNHLMDLENLSESEVKRLQEAFSRLAAKGDAGKIVQEAQADLHDAEKEISQARSKLTNLAEDVA